jgi:hypothetical protein
MNKNVDAEQKILQVFNLCIENRNFKYVMCVYDDQWDFFASIIYIDNN